MAVALVGLGASLPVTPAGATATSRRGPDTTKALVALESEVMALVELHAFTEPLSPKLRDVDTDWRHGVEGYDRSGLLVWLQSSEDDGAAQLEQLAALDLSPDVRQALGRLSADDVRATEEGRPISVPQSVYEHALNDLEFRSGSGPARAPAGTPAAGTPAGGVSAGPVGAPVASVPAAAPVTAAPTTAPATTTVTPTTTAVTAVEPRSVEPVADAEREPRSGATSWAPIVAAVVAGLVLAAVLVFAARRRRSAAPVGDLGASVAELLDAGRRLSASVDAGEIVAILADEAVALTRSTSATVVLRDGAGVAVAARSVAPGIVGDGVTVDVAAACRGAVGRVLDTGSVVRTVGVDPALGPDPVALVAVPLVRDGSVVGTVVATRPADRAYGTAELDLLAQLVPLAAAALVAAGRHDDVALLSLTDGLTELGNRRRLDRDLVAVLGAGTGSVGFVMVDIDHFKHFNDTNGHVAGDDALRQVAEVLRDNVRSQDVVYRYGGEEFCVLLPDATPAEAVEVSERLRRAVEERNVPGGETQPGGRLTISVGTTVAARTDPTAIKQRADLALYEAKHRGRNRVVLDEG